MIKSKFILASLGAAAALLSNAHAAVVQLDRNESEVVNGAIFQFASPQPTGTTGTGFIDPFLRLHAGGNTGTEQGYNTSGRPTAFDELTDPNFTKNVLYSDLLKTQVTINGSTYFQLLLDVNEPGGSKSLVSLTELQIYTSGTGSQTTSNVASLGTLRYDLDGNGDNTVVFDASLNHGSGSGDAYIYIPFFAAQNSDFVYLYAAFGDAEGDVQAGFEEFALVHNVTPVPELSSFFPIIGLTVAVGSTSYLRKRKLAQTVA
jgi:hypothetical protein